MKFNRERTFTSEELQHIWRKNHAHPFVKEMGDGTLDQREVPFLYDSRLYLFNRLL